jgi:phosphoenolpyruvate carboxykinase (GTP)
MEGRVHGEYDAIETPRGYIPKFEDLKDLFKNVFDRDYTRDEYNSQFSIRIAKFIEKMERMEGIFNKEENIPAIFMGTLNKLKGNLTTAREEYKQDIVPPENFS